MLNRLRRLFPPTGAQYELFDCSVLLIVLGFVGYVLTSPTGAVRGGVAFYVEANPVTWGWVLTAAAVTGIATSYSERFVRLGYTAVVMAATFWSGGALFGVLFLDAGLRGIVSATLYGWIVSRLVREVIHA